MKKILAVILAVLVVGGAVFCITSQTKTTSITDYAMNTVISVTVTSRNCREDALAVVDEVRRVESLMSATLPESDIYKINSAKAGTAVSVSDEVYSLLELSLEISKKTDGIFDISINPLSELWDFNSEKPSVPEDEQIKKTLELVNYKDIVLNPEDKTVTLKKEGMSISLGAVAKGYAADCCAELLKKRGVKEAIIDLGGNIYVVGKNKTIGIQTPYEKRGTYFTTCRVSDKSVVTSGAYERYFTKGGKIYHHILDTQNGYPSRADLKSVSVVSENSALADGLSTAFFASGEKKARELAKKFPDVEVIMLTENDRTVRLTD